MIKSLDQASAKTTKITKKNNNKELHQQKALQEKKKPSAGLVLRHPKLEKIQTQSVKSFPTFYGIHVGQEIKPHRSQTG